MAITGVPQSKRREIAAVLLARVQALAAIKTATFEDVKLESGDFAERDLPAVQIYDSGEDPIIPENVQVRKSWQITVELILGPIVALDYQPTQGDIWDLLEYVERGIFNGPQLGIPKVIGMQLIRTYTDLHFMKPFYLGKIELQIDYYQGLVRDC